MAPDQRTNDGRNPGTRSRLTAAAPITLSWPAGGLLSAWGSGDWQGGRRLGFRKEEGVAAPCGRVEILEINFYFQPAQIKKQKKELHSSFIICSNSYFPDYIFTSSSASRVCKFVHRISFGPNTTCANKGAVF